MSEIVRCKTRRKEIAKEKMCEKRTKIHKIMEKINRKQCKIEKVFAAIEKIPLELD